jgi:hypothetical protein
MAGQRRGQLHRDRARGGPRRWGLGLLGSLLIAGSACGGDADGPDPLGPGRNPGGSSGGGSNDPTVVGSWENVSVIQVPGDVQRWTTVWLFDAEGMCQQTVETESLAEGQAHVTERACTYATAAGEITIHYLGAGTLTFDFSFADFSPDRLVLDGFEYQRLS